MQAKIETYVSNGPNRTLTKFTDTLDEESILIKQQDVPTKQAIIHAAYEMIKEIIEYGYIDINDTNGHPLQNGSYQWYPPHRIYKVNFLGIED